MIWNRCISGLAISLLVGRGLDVGIDSWLALCFATMVSSINLAYFKISYQSCSRGCAVLSVIASLFNANVKNQTWRGIGRVLRWFSLKGIESLLCASVSEIAMRREAVGNRGQGRQVLETGRLLISRPRTHPEDRTQKVERLALSDRTPHEIQCESLRLPSLPV